MSDWNLAKMYQKMLDDGVYSDLKSLCEAEGINYENWTYKIKLSNVPEIYIGMFVKSAHIPSTFSKKLTHGKRLLMVIHLQLDSKCLLKISLLK